MSEQPIGKLNDDIIREAIKLEVESIDAPHQSVVWQKIESRLETPRRASVFGLRRFPWNRLAAVAAIFLVVILGGIGLFRTVQFGSAPAADGLSPVIMDDEITISEVEDDLSEEMVAAVQESEDTVSIESVTPPAGETEQKRPEWALVLAEGYRLSNTIILSDDSESLYDGAFYQGDSAELLLVRAEPTGESLEQFIVSLGIMIGAELNVVGERNGYLHFETFEMPGLAWQKEYLNQALMVTSGNIDIIELELIAEGLD
ncbi:MAG: hypothetical protein ACNA7Z_03105 [Dethiobacteria bacterium]|nr:hypothetical protein [Bacillota bacterium]